MGKIYLWFGIVLTQAITSFAENTNEDPASPKRCYSSKFGILEPDETRQGTECCMEKCLATGVIEILSCDVIEVADNTCYVEENSEANFPDCCPRLVCA